MLTENLYGNCLSLSHSIIFDTYIVSFDDREISLFPPLIDFQVRVQFGFEDLEAHNSHVNFLFDVVVEDVIGRRRGEGQKKTFGRKIQNP